MRTSLDLLRVATLAALILGAASQDSRAQAGIPIEDVLDHFRCYEVVDFDPQPPLWPFVTLEDQYEIENVQIGRPRLFCNPVDKQHGPVFWDMVDPRDHLTCYEVFGNIYTNRANRIVNQFQTRDMTMNDPELLCLPTEKNSEGFPPELDHFKCYQVQPLVPPLFETVFLHDQFGTSNAVVLQPETFCNPTRKTTPDGTSFGILHPEAHLTCYRIQDGIQPFPEVGVRHQFLPDGSWLLLGEARQLCVPSLKQVIPPPSCGLGFELLFAMPALRWLLARRRRA